MTEPSIPLALRERIRELQHQLGAVILAHNYQQDAVQELADFTGDSLELSRKAAQTDAQVIVFCGVHFMAETAAILCPGRLVLLPDLASGCPMADMVDGAGLRQLKAEHPGANVVCYVNSTAEVKAESTICCTSANAVQVVASLPADREIIFVPDRHLGSYVQEQTGRALILWPGFCPTHQRIQPEELLALRQQHPDALVLVHPECDEATRAVADEVLSTGGMCRFVAGSSASTFIIGTEVGLLYRLRRENPDRRFILASEWAVCPNMKRITPAKVLAALETLQHPITVPEEIRSRARASLDRMLAVT